MPNESRFRLTKDLPIETRRAQNVDSRLSSAIRDLCANEPGVLACYLLDTRMPGDDATVLVIALTLERGEEGLSTVAPRFQGLLAHFPEQAKKTYILMSDQFKEKYSGYEFYKLVH